MWSKRTCIHYVTVCSMWSERTCIHYVYGGASEPASTIYLSLDI